MKSEVVYTEGNNERELSLRAVSYPVTKGAELTGISIPKDWGIYAAATQYSSDGSIENSSYFASPFEKMFGTNEDNPANTNRLNASADSRLWKGSSSFSEYIYSPVYWPIGDARLNYLAYAMPYVRHSATGLSSGAWSATWDYASTDVASSVTFKGVDTYANQVDVLFAASNNQHRSENAGKDAENNDQSVAMVFQHAQALLIFNIRVNDAVNNLININEIGFYSDDYVNQLREYEVTARSYAIAHAKWVAWKADYDLIPVDEQAAWLVEHPEPENPSAPGAPVRVDGYVTLKTVGTFNVDNRRNSLLYSWNGLSSRSTNCVMPQGPYAAWLAAKATWDSRSAEYKAAHPEEDPGAAPAADLPSWSNRTVLEQTSQTVQPYGVGVAYIAGDEYAQLGDALLVPEQNKANFTIKYQMDMDHDGSFDGERVMYYTYNDVRGAWKAGSKYVYNLDLNLNEISVTESVGDFSSVYVASPGVSFASKPSTAMAVGTTFNLVCSTLSSGGVVFSSSDPGVATVSPSGVITAVAAGTTTISVSLVEDSSVSDSFVLTVGSSESVSVTNKIASIDVGGSHTLSYSASGEVVFSSSDTDVATVDESGVISADGIGSTTIRVALSANASVYDEFTLEVVPVIGTFAGLYISPGPLYYDGTSYEMANHWNVSSFDSVLGKVSGSTFFNFAEMGALFEKDGFTWEDAAIDNYLDPFSGWRLATVNEWEAVTSDAHSFTHRDGSTVNGVSGARYAYLELEGVTHSGNSTPSGVLLFPDGKTITGKVLDGINDNTKTTGVTETELNAYLARGCVFLPMSGYGYYDSFYEGGSYGDYWSSNDYFSAGGIDFSLNAFDTCDSDIFDAYYVVRLVKFAVTPTLTLTSVPTSSMTIGDDFTIVWDCDVDVEFLCSDTDVAFVSEDGIISAYEEGSVTITVRVKGDASISESFNVTVVAS